MRKKIASFGAVALGAGALVCGSTAYAQEASYLRQRVPAPSQALELQVGTSYTQGFGNILPGQGLPSVAGPGIGFDLGVGYRHSQHWSEGLEGQYQEFANGQNAAARGLAFAVNVTYHLNPTLRGDPFARMGGGYRTIWSINPPGGPTTMVGGFEIAKAAFGYDVRFSPDFALSPLAGADLDVFVLQGTNGVVRGISPQLAMFVYAGLAGRFDIGGPRAPAASVAAVGHR
jgi:hypothetical protein